MRARNPKFLNRPVRIMGLTFTEIISSLGVFFLLSNVMKINPFGAIIGSLIALILMLGNRKFPSFYLFHFFFKDSVIKKEKFYE